MKHKHTRECNNCNGLGLEKIIYPKLFWWMGKWEIRRCKKCKGRGVINVSA